MKVGFTRSAGKVGGGSLGGFLVEAGLETSGAPPTVLKTCLTGFRR
jgi:hypothetical protein